MKNRVFHDEFIFILYTEKLECLESLLQQPWYGTGVDRNGRRVEAVGAAVAQQKADKK